MSRRERYTPAERIEAVHLAREIGDGPAARALEIPRGTVQEWHRNANADVIYYYENEADDPLRDDESLPWDERMRIASLAYARTSRAARRLADELLAAGKSRDAQYALTTSAIATDKAQLLAGRATSRSESRSLRMNVDGARLAGLLGELPSRSADRPAVPQSRPAAIEARSSEGASEGFVIPTESASDQPKRRRSTGGRPRKGPKNVSDTPVVPEGE